MIVSSDRYRVTIFRLVVCRRITSSSNHTLMPRRVSAILPLKRRMVRSDGRIFFLIVIEPSLFSQVLLIAYLFSQAGSVVISTPLTVHRIDPSRSFTLPLRKVFSLSVTFITGHITVHVPASRIGLPLIDLAIVHLRGGRVGSERDQRAARDERLKVFPDFLLHLISYYLNC